MTQLQTIAKSEQESFIGSFWAMMRQLEEAARDGDALDKHYVEAYYRQWNRVTDDNQVPHWIGVQKND